MQALFNVAITILPLRNCESTTVEKFNNLPGIVSGIVLSSLQSPRRHCQCWCWRRFERPHEAWTCLYQHSLKSISGLRQTLPISQKTCTSIFQVSLFRLHIFVVAQTTVSIVWCTCQYLQLLTYEEFPPLSMWEFWPVFYEILYCTGHADADFKSPIVYYVSCQRHRNVSQISTLWDFECFVLSLDRKLISTKRQFPPNTGSHVYFWHLKANNTSPQSMKIKALEPCSCLCQLQASRTFLEVASEQTFLAVYCVALGPHHAIISCSLCSLVYRFTSICFSFWQALV